MNPLINKNSIKKILIIKLRGIGDIVLSTIIFDPIREYFHDATIDFLTEHPSKSILEKLSFLNKIHVFDRKSVINKIKTALEIRKDKYDLVIDLFSNPSSAQIVFLCGAKYRLGFPYKGRKYAYNIFGPAERAKIHSADLHLELIKGICPDIGKKKLYLSLDDEDNSFVNKYLSKNTSSDLMLVGISPSGGWASKRCDPHKFAEIVHSIKKKYRCEVIILWGPEDKKDAEKIHAMTEMGTHLAPDTTLNLMASFINACDIFISNDSGPMHISTAVGTPTLSIHGPTSPTAQGPYGNKHEWIRLEELDCIECNLLVCPKKHECFNELPVEKVIEKIELLIRKNNIKVN